MSQQIEIFVASDLSLGELARELEQVLEVTLQAKSEGRDSWYEATPEGIWLDLIEHRFPLIFEDDEYPFAEFPYYIRLAGRINYWVEREKRLYEYAQLSFNQLQAYGAFRLLMLDEMETKLGEFTPDGS